MFIFAVQRSLYCTLGVQLSADTAKSGRRAVALKSLKPEVIVKEQYQQKDIRLLEKLLRFADLVVIAERLHPIPFRTRP